MRLKNIYSSRLNKRASARDPLLINFRLSKRGQFFILSAVIIASIIVSLASVQNFVSTGDAPKKFYYYSQQLEDETGAVVDYALYNDPSGSSTSVKSNLNNFLQQSIGKTMDAYPSMEVFSCYSAADSTKLICQNNGTKTIKVNTTDADSLRTLYGSRDQEVISLNSCMGNKCPTKLITSDSLSIADKDKIFVTLDDGQVYTIPIQNSGVQRGQFYFLLKMNTPSGDYLADSTGTKPA